MKLGLSGDFASLPLVNGKWSLGVVNKDLILKQALKRGWSVDLTSAKLASACLVYASKLTVGSLGLGMALFSLQFSWLAAIS